MTDLPLSKLSDGTTTYEIKDAAARSLIANKQDSSTAVKHPSAAAVGSAIQPVYITSNGAATATTYSLEKSVPSDAVFTDTTYSAFTGTDGSSAGSSGLVPAPTASDTNKYLKSDGTWATLATVATTGAYSDLTGTPIIPTVNNATLTIIQGGVNKGTFTANADNDVIITLDTGSGTVDIDNNTITQNSQNKIQAVAVINQNSSTGTINPLKLWEGTESQWNTSGESETWYYWNYFDSVTGWTSVSLSNNIVINDVAYGDSKFVAIASDGNGLISSNGGQTWSDIILPQLGEYQFWKSIVYGNDKFVAIAQYTDTMAYSTDGINWTTSSLPEDGIEWQAVTYGNGKFVVISSYSKGITAISTDGENWSSGGTLPNDSEWKAVTFGNGKFVAIATGSDVGAVSTDGTSWSAMTMPSESGWCSIAYGNGKFVAIDNSSNTAAISSDGETWTTTTLPTATDSNYEYITWGASMFMAFAPDYIQNTTTTAISSDGVTWTTTTLPSLSAWNKAVYGNNKFVAFNIEGSATAYISAKTCYTDTVTPTTQDTVYSEPDTASLLTITAVGNNTITLSDTITYDYAGSDIISQSIGDTYPEYICYIDGIGIKKGNTVIAQKNDVVDQSYNPSSSNAQSGIAIAGILGDIETLLSQI